MEINMDGFDELRKKIEELEGENRVPVNELLTSAFMKRWTDFSAFDQMVEESPFAVETAEDFESIPDDEWDEYVDQTTRFESWQEMINRAAAEYTKRKLDL